MKPSLLIIDMQKVSYAGPSKDSMDKAALVINKALVLFREKHLPVVWIQNDNRGDAAPGTERFAMIDSLKPLEGETIIVKRHLNSFFQTGLTEYLASEKVDTPIVTGYAAEYCVLSTYRGAGEQGLGPLVLNGAIAGSREPYLQMTERLCESLSFGALKKMLELLPA